MLVLVVSTTLGAEGGPGVSMEFKKGEFTYYTNKEGLRVYIFGFQDSQRHYYSPHPTTSISKGLFIRFIGEKKNPVIY